MEVEVNGHPESIQKDWDELADRAGAPPWLRPGWLMPWADAFAGGAIELITAREDGTLQALLAVQRDRQNARSLSNYHSPAFGMLTTRTEASRAVTDALFGLGYRRVALSFLPEIGFGLGEFRAAADAHGYRTLQRTLEQSPYITLTGTWEAYLSGVSSKVVRELRRRRRRLEQHGRVDLTVFDGQTNLASLLAETFRVEAAGWKGKRRTAMGANANTTRFYSRVAEWAATRGWLRLAYLRLDEKAIAVDFGFEVGGRHYLLKTGYDEAYRRFAPGMLMRLEMIKKAFNAGMHRYDFLGHDDPWKLVWTRSTDPQYLLQTFRSSPFGTVDYVAYRYGRPLAKRLMALSRR